MDLTLYRVVGTQNRVALGDLAAGVEFYSVDKATDGVVTLTPVRIRDGIATRRSDTWSPAAEDEDQADPQG